MENIVNMDNSDRTMAARKRNIEDTEVKRDIKNYPNGSNFTRPGLVNKTGTDNQHHRVLAIDQQNDDEPGEVDKYGVYNFKDSGDGKSWLLGDDSETYGNAFIGGNTKCPENITVPRNLTNEKGVTRPVEVIGRYAYYTCGLSDYGEKTKSVFVTKQVRIIKYLGFGAMWDVESFRIEEGSVLESIEQWGLHGVGYLTGHYDENKRGTLTLPSTLTSVAEDGIFWCNLYKVIVYCGTHNLNNSCTLDWNVNLKTKVKVTNQYTESTTFGYNALKDAESQKEVIEKCFGMSGNPFEKTLLKTMSFQLFQLFVFSFLIPAAKRMTGVYPE